MMMLPVDIGGCGVFCAEHVLCRTCSVQNKKRGEQKNGEDRQTRGT